MNGDSGHETRAFAASNPDHRSLPQSGPSSGREQSKAEIPDDELIAEIVDEAQIAWDHMKPFLNRVARRLRQLIAEQNDVKLQRNSYYGLLCAARQALEDGRPDAALSILRAEMPPQ